ncbi:MAG TPA: STAS domain-containing protein [Candidatus Limnocylindrales bacterium]|nr:STAS domain-containing protein [Candidatus Limnocylindrales bacterium]
MPRRLVLGEESANLRHLVRDHLLECNQVVVDLGNASYIDSSGIGVLVSLFSTAKRAGGGIKLAKLSPQLENTLQITKILTVFEVFDRAEDAATSFNTNAGQCAAGEWPLDD